MWTQQTQVALAAGRAWGVHPGSFLILGYATRDWEWQVLPSWEELPSVPNKLLPAPAGNELAWLQWPGRRAAPGVRTGAAWRVSQLYPSPPSLLPDSLFPSHVLKATPMAGVLAAAQTPFLPSQLSLLCSSALVPHHGLNPAWPTQTLLSRASLWLVLVPAQCPRAPYTIPCTTI